MSNPHDAHVHEATEAIIPVGSWQDRLLEFVAAIALAGLVFWGWQMSQPIAVPHADGHEASHETTEMSGETHEHAGHSE